MDDYDPMTTFDPEAAARYDDHSPRADTESTVSFLADLAARRGGAPVLELAVGTGRIALSLAGRGFAVDGVDLSPAMIDQLRAKPRGDQIAVTVADMADLADHDVPGPYGLIYLVFNTLFNLLTQDEQVRCFEHVAARLGDDGSFVVEAFVPAYLHRLRDHQYVDAEAIGVGDVRLDVGRHDPVSQRLDESHVSLSAAGVHVHPVVCRYAWPSELDLMARIAGLRLKDRWAGWSLEPFTAHSRSHVSVYGR